MISIAPPLTLRLPPLEKAAARFPGLALCGAVTALATLLQLAEIALFGRAWLDALVLAILLGAGVRTAWTPPQRMVCGIGFAAKTLLEVAVVLLGSTLSAGMVCAAGGALLLGIVAVVATALSVGYLLGRTLGLPHRMAALIACGNAICGNSAIAAAAPILGADAEEVAASIAFTAVLGVGVVLALPLLAFAWRMNPKAFGVFAGLTVYAVPQVLAATTPVSAFAAQVGTLVKLVRVLMLGPVLLALSILNRREAVRTASAAGGRPAPEQRPPLAPWFILGFIFLAGLRSAGFVPTSMLAPASQAANALTLVSMAALGLSVDVRVVANAGARVVAAATLSLLALGGAAFLVIRTLGL